MPKPNPIDDLATAMAAELDRDTEKLAKSLAPEMQLGGAEKMTKAQMRDLGYRNWNNMDFGEEHIPFRQAMLKQMGNGPFIEYSQDIEKVLGHPPMPPLDLSGMLQPPTVNSGMAPMPGGPSVG